MRELKTNEVESVIGGIRANFMPPEYINPAQKAGQEGGCGGDPLDKMGGIRK